jgi:sulfur-carrier protein adenylyltransferase/sulfurtransferase
MSSDGAHAPGVPEITPAELKSRLDRQEPVVLIDVREPHEYAIADLPEMGQLRIPMRQVAERAAELDKDADLVIYCRSGARSGRVAAQLLANGFERVWNLKGGVLRWREDVDPTLRTY